MCHEKLICSFTYDKTGGAIQVNYTFLTRFINEHYSRRVAYEVIDATADSPLIEEGPASSIGGSNATDIYAIQAAFNSVKNGGDYDGVNGLQCVDIVKWYIDTYTTFISTRGNGKDIAKNVADANNLAVSDIPKAPAVYSVAAGVKAWGGSGTNPYGHTGIVVAVTNTTATVLHTGNSLTGKTPNSWTSIYPYPQAGVSFTYLGR